MTLPETNAHRLEEAHMICSQYIIVYIVGMLSLPMIYCWHVAAYDDGGVAKQYDQVGH